MKGFKTFLFLLVFTFGKNSFCQEISNLLAKRIANGGIEIKYDLISLNKNDSAFFVELFLFKDDKLLYKVNDATGDIGFKVLAGNGHRIFWNPFIKDNNLLIENARFKLTAIPKNKEGMALIVGGNKTDLVNNLVYEIKSFYADKTEVSYYEFKTFVDEFNYETESEISGNSYAIINGSFGKEEKYNWRYNAGLKKIISEQDNNKPIIFISYNDAAKYCEWKKKRLPTDIEWDVMATNCFEYPILSQPTDNAWYSENALNTNHEINSLKSNSLGMYHLFGNVSEWCNFDLSSHLKSIPNNKSTASVRGGSFITSEKDLNINYRTSGEKTHSFQDVGFRCVSTIIE